MLPAVGVVVASRSPTRPRRATDPVAANILRYFRRNPGCVDDLDGIARWRLLEERVAEVVGETARALDRLVDEGLLIRIDTPGLRQRYRLHPSGAGFDAAEEDGADPRAPGSPPSARRPRRRPSSR